MREKQKLLVKSMQNSLLYWEVLHYLDHDYEIHDRIIKRCNENGWTFHDRVDGITLNICERIHLMIMEGCLKRNKKIYKKLKSLD